MPLFRSRRVRDDVDAQIARERVANLRATRVKPTPAPRRQGWVPQVPRNVVAPAEPSWPTSERRLDAAVDRYWNPPDEGADRHERRRGRHRARDASTRDFADNVAATETGSDPTTPADPLDLGADGDPSPGQRGDRLGMAAARFGIGRAHLIAVALALMVGLVVTGVMAWAGRPQVQPVDAEVIAPGTPLPENVGPEGDAEAPASGGSESNHTESGEVVVHVDGKVAAPGVVTLPAGSRVVDAIDAAGGVEPDVDLAPLNLARVLTDGEQVLVGIDPPPGAADGVPDGGGPGAASSGGRLDLNRATAGDLEALPGIGPTLAQRILTWRAEHGTFSTVEELREVTGIGERKFADLEPLVTV